MQPATTLTNATALPTRRRRHRSTKVSAWWRDTPLGAVHTGECMVTRYAFRGGSHWRQSRKSTKLVFDFRLSRRFVDSLSRSTLSPKFNMFNSVDLSKVGNFCRRNIARMSNVLSILWPMCTGPNRHGRLSCRIWLCRECVAAVRPDTLSGSRGRDLSIQDYNISADERYITQQCSIIRSRARLAHTSLFCRPQIMGNVGIQTPQTPQTSSLPTTSAPFKLLFFS